MFPFTTFVFLLATLVFLLATFVLVPATCACPPDRAPPRLATSSTSALSGWTAAAVAPNGITVVTSREW
jgi:hypothetical protein